MAQKFDFSGIFTIIEAFDAEIQALSSQTIPNVRKIRKKYSGRLASVDPESVYKIVLSLVHDYGHRGIAYELIRFHPDAFANLAVEELETLGQGIDSWWAVDSFARTLSGPAWLKGQITDAVVLTWAVSEDLWWRRAALVSTVALNIRSKGDYGDTPRTLSVCRLLVDDHEDMVIQGLSWALRALVPHDPKSIQNFLAIYNGRLAARVTREVRNKIETGVKNPKKQSKNPQ